MTPTRRLTVLLVLCGTGAASWAGWALAARRGVLPPEVPWTVPVLLLAIAAAVLVLGWTVRQYQQGKRPGIDMIRAARTAVLGKASAFTGAVLGGWYGGQLLCLLGELVNEPLRRAALAAALATVAALVLAVVGLLVERFCRLPPPKDEPAAGEEPTPA